MGVSEVPDRAQVVVVGGGVIGCSVAYHLAALGCTEVVLLERDRLTSGTTWHSAGLMVRFGSMSATSTDFRCYTHELYRRLESDTGLSTGFRPVGFVELATDADRLREFRRIAAFNRFRGVDVHEISAAEVGRLFPPARTDDVLAGFYVPDDGRVNPVDVTMALAAGARARGVRIVEGVPVERILTGRGAGGPLRVEGVATAQGRIEAETVVVCAGAWTRELVAPGVTVPLQAAEHSYVITEPIPGLTPDLPVLEDPRNFGYYRPEGDGLMVGLFEAEPAPWSLGGMPADFSFGRIRPDWDRMAPFVEAALSRVPAAAEAGIRTFFCGPESFTPDGSPVLGEVPEVRGYFVAAGMNSIGILTGGGVGRAVAHWIVTGAPDIDVTWCDPARFHPFQSTLAYRRERTAASLAAVYACHYPTVGGAGRIGGGAGSAGAVGSVGGVRRSPVHDRLAAAGACFGDVAGWQVPQWFAGPGREPDPGPPTFGRAPWFPAWEAEHRAVREGVALLDQSCLGVLRIEGADAATVLARLGAPRGVGGPGRITRRVWSGPSGCVEADVTLACLDEDAFLVISSGAAVRRTLGALRRGVGDARASVLDGTAGYAQLNLAGPLSRRVLAAVTPCDVSDGALGSATVRELEIGFARVYCLRLASLGELGYELLVPAEHAVEVLDLVREAGAPLGLRYAGWAARTSLRLEKGYREFGRDVLTTDPVDELLPPPRADAARADAGGRSRRSVQILLGDPGPLLWHGEVVRRSGAPIGVLRSGSYGWTLGGAVGLALLDAGSVDEPITQAWLDAAPLDVEIAGRRYPATASLRALFDPTGERSRG